jgi:hypothetical protein
MNCKPGDMAIVVKGHQPNLGKIVTILRHPTQKDIDAVFVNPPKALNVAEIWMIDQPMQTRPSKDWKPIIYMQLDVQMIPLNADLEEEDALLFAEG